MSNAWTIRTPRKITEPVAVGAAKPDGLMQHQHREGQHLLERIEIGAVDPGSELGRIAGAGRGFGASAGVGVNADDRGIQRVAASIASQASTVV